MTTLRPMRLFLRQIAVCSFAVSLVFFCSCERHKSSELPAEQEHGKTGAVDAQEAAAPHAAETGESAPAATPAGTPAQFFPAASTSPR